MKVYCINYISEEYGNPRTLMKICSTYEKAKAWLDDYIRRSCDDTDEDWYWEQCTYYEIVEEEVD